MSDFKGGRRGFRNNNQKQRGIKQESGNQSENNPVILCFKEYSKELDEKHDRYERIVKQGRDITIESKRIIFLLHTIDPKKDNKERVLKEAERRLQDLCETSFMNIAKELDSLDPYQYTRAYSPGLQEFIEAYNFCQYLNGKKICGWETLQKKLTFNLSKESTSNDKVDERQISCLIQPMEFILGLADVSGEVMRRCINSLGSGDMQACFESCRLIQSMYSGYLAVKSVRNRELSRKIYTLRQSVLKTESVCYNIKVRGGEAAMWETVTDPLNEKFDEDEGYF